MFTMWLSSGFQLVLYTTALGSIAAICILILKLIIKDNLGVRWNYWVWLLLLVRLLVPYAPQSSFSVFNVLSFNKSASIQLNNLSAVAFINSQEVTKGQEQNNIDNQKPSSVIDSSKNNVNLQIFLFKLASILWLAGAILLIGVTIFKTINLYY